jgi:molybdate transport system substrate-binding protein
MQAMMRSLGRSQMWYPFWLWCCVACLLFSSSSAVHSQSTNSAAPVTELRVAAAADLQSALPELVRAFEKTSPSVKMSVVYGSSGNLFAQIKAGAPFQIFFSADTKFASELAAQNLAASAPRNYAVGRLVLWMRNDIASVNLQRDSIDVGMRELVKPIIRRIALANPAHAPYGQRAREVLQYYGLWSAVESKLVLAENVAQAAQYAQAGTVQAALLPLSLVLGSPPATQGASQQAVYQQAMYQQGAYQQGFYQLIPERSHTPLVQSAIVLQNANRAQRETATAFVEFCCSQAGQALLRKYGFAPAR